MTQEEKVLLLQDLSARLPYGVQILADIHKEFDGGVISTLKAINLKKDWVELQSVLTPFKFDEIKPYLRPISSMTEEEKEELKSKCTHTETEEDWEGVRCDVWGIQILDKYDTRRWDNPIWPSTINMDAIDWLNKKMFDYRGLIPMDLAIEITEENNPYESNM